MLGRNLGGVSVLVRAAQAIFNSLTVAANAVISGGLVMGAASGGNKGAGTINATAIYDDNVQLVPSVHSYARLEHNEANNTNGGSTVATTYTRRKLAEIVDPDGIVTVDTVTNIGRFTLATPGTYEFAFSGTIGGNGSGVPKGHHRIRNITDGADVAYSTSCSGVSTGENNSGFGSGRVVIAGSKDFELQYWHSAAIANVGLGNPLNTGQTEVYAVVEIIRVA